MNCFWCKCVTFRNGQPAFELLCLVPQILPPEFQVWVGVGVSGSPDWEAPVPGIHDSAKGRLRLK